MNSRNCSHCKKTISRGTRYLNKISSVSVSELIEIADPEDADKLQQEVARLVHSTDKTKNEQQLMDEVFIEMTFELCGMCRDKFVSGARYFSGQGKRH